MDMPMKKKRQTVALQAAAQGAAGPVGQGTDDAGQPDRVFTDEAPGLGIVIPMPVIVQTRFSLINTSPSNRSNYLPPQDLVAVRRPDSPTRQVIRYRRSSALCRCKGMRRHLENR